MTEQPKVTHTMTTPPARDRLHAPLMDLLLTDAAARAVVNAVHGPGEPEQWQLDNAYIALGDAVNTLSEDAGMLFVVEGEWEYGYRSTSFDGRDLGVSTTTRTPGNWLNHMSPPKRRLKLAAHEQEWEDAPEPVVIQLDRRPWLRPGGHPQGQPLHNRSPHNPGGWEFSPDAAYEQDIDRYGFRYAACGSTDEHWPHGKTVDGGFTYCSGMLNPA